MTWSAYEYHFTVFFNADDVARQLDTNTISYLGSKSSGSPARTRARSSPTARLAHGVRPLAAAGSRLGRLAQGGRLSRARTRMASRGRGSGGDFTNVDEGLDQFPSEIRVSRLSRPERPHLAGGMGRSAIDPAADRDAPPAAMAETLSADERDSRRARRRAAPVASPRVGRVPREGVDHRGSPRQR